MRHTPYLLSLSAAPNVRDASFGSEVPLEDTKLYVRKQPMVSKLLSSWILCTSIRQEDLLNIIGATVLPER